MASKDGATDASAVLEAAPAMSNLRRNLFEYAMHIRQLSPRVEMMRQVALTATPREAHGLEVFATLGPKHYSSLGCLLITSPIPIGSGWKDFLSYSNWMLAIDWIIICSMDISSSPFMTLI